MRRLLLITFLIAGLGAFAVMAGGASDGEGGRKYTIEMDNAFGLIEGGDLKIAGVRAGKITDMRLDQRTHRALIDIEITQNGFGSLRTDVRCESRPQSLIGEYFIDCLPGAAATELRDGARIPVSRTSSTIAPDLVNNVLRRPYRERLSIIVNELGAAVAGNAENLNAAVRRAAPALRETNQVLAVLARQNRVLGDLVRDADKVIGDLADNRRDVARWIKEAGETASASAERKDDIAAGFREFPDFLRELEPAMADLQRVARDQTPALRNLNASAQQLERFFGNLEPFAEASTPAFKALGRASDVGERAVKAAAPVVDELGRLAPKAPDVGRNLALIGEHLDDREWAIEKDPRSPGGQGYTGLEALLTYIYDQTLSINVFDGAHHYLKVSVFPGRCANYSDIKRVKETPGLEEECGARGGPNGYGLNLPDPTRPADATDDRRRMRQRTDRTAPAPSEQAPPAFKPDAPPASAKPKTPELKLPEILPGVDVPPIKLPGVPPLGLDGKDGPLGARQDRAPDAETQSRLLDFLLGS